MNQVIDFSTLTWVKNELDNTLKEARQALEAHVENPRDEAQTGFLVAHLHQVFGTLQMVELYGAALLAEEMEHVARAIANQSVSQHDEACEVLMRATLQLPDYLDRLIAGYRDIPLVLLPLLNDLRAVRGEHLLSENAMFSPDLAADLPGSMVYGKTDEDLQKKSRDLRHRFQLGLLGWFRGKDPESALASLGKVLEELQEATRHAQVARLWWVGAGIIDALKSDQLDSGVAVKRLMGQIDRQIKRLIDHGEDALARESTEDLYKNLLFYAAQSPASCSERLDSIQSTYRLKELLPDENELAAARESMTGQNTDLFETVAVAVKEELARLKDSLDIVLRNGARGGEELAPLIASLNSLGDTLGMLSLGAARKAVVSKAADLQSCVDSTDTPADTALMDVASTLLFVESSVEGMGSGRAVAEEGRVEDQLAENEYNQVMDVVLQEALTDLRRAKEAVIAYTDADHDAGTLSEVPQWFNQVKGGLLLLNESRAAALVESVVRYISKELIENGKQASQQELDSLADSVCGLEYYLESRKEHRMYGSAAMMVAEQGVGKLGYPAESVEAGSAESDEQPMGAGDAGYVADAGDDSVVEAPETVDLDFSLLDEPGETVVEDVAGESENNSPEAVEPVIETSAPIEFVSVTAEVDVPADSIEDDTAAAGGEPAFDEPATLEMADSTEEVESGDSAPEVSAEAGEPVPESVDETETPMEDDDGLAIIGEDVDDEILEIFIEEAEEELASLNEQLPVWLANTEDADSMAMIRRSYHTLKGSGRLVGAMRIGEFAWAFENMLNRLIDGTISVTPEMKGLLTSALNAIPELVAQIKDATPTKQPIAYLMKCADALSAGEAMPEAVAAPAPAVTEPEIEASIAADDIADETAIEEAVHETDPAEPVQEQGELAPPVEEAEAQEPEVVTVMETPDDQDYGEISGEGVMDPMLYEIFNAETHAHLEVMRQFLNQAAAGETFVSEPLARAMHTLHGSAHMAEAEEIADLAGAFERYLKALVDASIPLDEESCQLLHDSVLLVENMMSCLPESNRQPGNFATIVARVNELREQVPEGDGVSLFGDVGDAEGSSVDKTGEAPGAVADGEADAVAADEEEPYPGAESDSAAVTDPYAEVDEELLEIFLEECTDNLEASDGALHRWRESADDREALEELQRILHTVKGGARMADLAAIGDVAHAVESLIIAISDGQVNAGDEAMDGVQQAQDVLAGMLENVRNREPLESADELVARLQSLREARRQTPVDEAPCEDQHVSGEPEAEVELEPAVARTGSADPYADTDSELLEVFLEEARDILENSEQTLQNWKHAPEEQHLMAELQRELHTLKGGARMADITAIGDLAHAVESLMVKVTEGGRPAGESMFAVLEQAQDKLAAMVEQVGNREPLSEAGEIISRLETLRDGGEIKADAHAKKSKSRSKDKKAAAVAVAVEADNEHLDRRSKSRNSQELVRVKADLLDNMVNYAGEVSIYRSRLEQQVGAYRFNLVEMDQTVSRLREQLRRLEIETEAQVLFRYEKESETANEVVDQGEDFDPLEMDRYSHMQQLSRSLMESVGDLGSIQNLLDNITRESETLLLQQSRVNTELQEGLMRTRMVPFLGLAARMRRIVRQTALELNKKAELELSGAEGEMDRTVVDRIIAPIEHMLRNAISHGIESPEERSAAGKPDAGTIKITLERESSDVVLKIADDGKGISLDAIRKKAIERGLMQTDSDLTDNEVLQFILETGFSTAEKVTQVAGRGVGMDVVNSEVKQLGGSLHIDSEYGKGTTFTIRLPFTLALNQALLIEVGEDTYAIPLSSIEGIVRMRREDLKAHYDDPEGRFEYGGFEYEVRHLGSTLGTGQPHLDNGPKRIPVLLARVGEHCVAFQVENLLGSREIVVKSVGPQISTVRGVSGATILGDGRVVMILDIAALLRGGSSAIDKVNELIHQPVRTAGLTVMVVDDSITVRKVTTRVLERNDMRVIAAKDGVDAVSKLQENIPDIMLLDIEMPRMDGFELATHVRNEARLRDIPIIMITSRTGDKHRQRAMQIGVNRYLGKPFQESDLLENIRALLEEKNLDG